MAEAAASEQQVSHMDSTLALDKTVNPTHSIPDTQPETNKTANSPSVSGQNLEEKERPRLSLTLQDMLEPEDEQSLSTPDSPDGLLSLSTLPSELLLHICTFLDARFVIARFSLVCKQFYQLVSDDIFWKVRIKKRWPQKYPPISVVESEFNWKEACIEREEQFSRWNNPSENLDYFQFRQGMSAPVDSVHLMQGGTRLAIGSRDRYLNLLDLTKLDSADPGNSMKKAQVFTKINAHKGWIWSMASQDAVLATGSWDMHIKFWDVAAEGQVVSDIKCKSAVLAMHYEPDFLVAGGFDKKVYHIDPRTATVLSEKKYHKKPVLAVAANDNYIMTGSEDSTIIIYDRRADDVLKTLQLANYPMCMSYYNNQLWVGDKQGLVHLVDATDGDFDIVETYNVGHKGKVTGIQYTPGALYTSSTDRTIRVHHPSTNPDTITTLADHAAEVATIHYQNGVLVSGGSDVSVGIWKPKW